MIIKNGTYNGKQLCDMIGLDNNKFKNNVSTYINKLSNYCTIEMIGNGRGRKYIITNSDEKEIDINFSERSDIGSTRENYDNSNALYKLFKAPIVYELMNSTNGTLNFTIHNWLRHMGMITNDYTTRKRESEYIELTEMERDFFNNETRTLEYNFKRAILELEKERVVIALTKLMIAKYVKDERDGTMVEFHTYATDEEENEYFDFIRKLNKRYNITNRLDLLFGNSSKGIKANRKLLKEYDIEVQDYIKKNLKGKYVYISYKIILRNEYFEEYEEKYIQDYDLEYTKDSIYFKRLNRCKARQQKVIDEIKKQEQRLIFGTISMLLVGKDDVYLKKYNGTYVDEWKELYKRYIYNNLKG